MVLVSLLLRADEKPRASVLAGRVPLATLLSWTLGR